MTQNEFVTYAVVVLALLYVLMHVAVVGAVWLLRRFRSDAGAKDE